MNTLNVDVNGRDILYTLEKKFLEFLSGKLDFMWDWRKKMLKGGVGLWCLPFYDFSV